MNKLLLGASLLAGCPKENVVNVPEPLSTYSTVIPMALPGVEMPRVAAQVTECAPFSVNGIPDKEMAGSIAVEAAQRRLQAAIFAIVDHPIIIGDKIVKEPGQYAEINWDFLHEAGVNCLDYKTETFEEYPGNLCVTMSIYDDWFAC